jgi:hypothetical protein
MPPATNATTYHTVNSRICRPQSGPPSRATLIAGRSGELRIIGADYWMAKLIARSGLISLRSPV